MPSSKDRPFIARVPLVGALWEFSQTDARWAKILEIKRTGRLAQILLEVHNADTPPYEHWTRTLVPRGRDPKVGDDVYWVDKTAPNSNHRAISIKWGREPNYGSPRPTNEDLEQAFLTPFMSNPVFDAGKAAAGDPDRQLEILEQRHADGELSMGEFEHNKEDLRTWAADPEAENDPAVHRRRLEERRSAGKVTDAEYAQRSAELDAWERGLAQVRSSPSRP